MDFSQILTFFSSLFQKQEFFARFLERRFFATHSLIELGVAAVVIFIAYKIAIFLNHRYFAKEDQTHFLRYWSSRLIFPIFILLLGLIATSIWNKWSGHQVVWLRLLMIAAPWMMMIRTFTSVLHYIMPGNRFSSSSEKFLSGLIWLGFILWFTGLSDTLYRWSNNMVFSLGKTKISLYNLANGVFWVAISIMMAMWLAQVFENRLMKLERMNLSLRIVLGKVAKTLMVFLAILITLPAVGIDLTVLSVFGGALGIGLGFGLQKIASNYVSGFIILLERSVRVNDYLTVSGFSGIVTKIYSRYVVLQAPTGEEALIPNETFVSSTIINKSFTDGKVWRKLDVQVAYNTDIPQALTILEEAAKSCPRVDKEKPPRGLVREFADSGINLAIGFWVANSPTGYSSLDSEILLEIWKRFKANNIEFPYPQREVRILNP